MTQTRLGSLIEAAANVAIGYGVALLSQIVIFPMFDIHVPISTNLAIGAWFTLHDRASCAGLEAPGERRSRSMKTVSTESIRPASTSGGRENP